MKLPRRTGTISLDDRLAALHQAADLAEGRLDPEVVDPARAVVRRAGARAALSSEHTVAALAGATGSGKSSLFNALAGTELAAVGATRPTTSSAQAARWHAAGSEPLLDWLNVPRRHTVGAEPAGPDGTHATNATGTTGTGTAVTHRTDATEATGTAVTAGAADDDLAGLILLDLPDHDSIEVTHRLEVDRLVGVVDLLVWVLDPQKYADAAVHERYLRPLARHKDVMVVVLNQADRLPAAALDRCLDDLRRLLAEDGLDGVPVLAASARTGLGLTELRGLLAGRVVRRRAWADRLAADARAAADALAAAAGAATVPSGGPDGGRAAGRRTGSLDERLGGPLTTALADAAGVPAVVDAVARAHRHRAVVATGWPATRWLRRLRPDPLRRLRVGGGTGRTSLPAASSVQRSQLEVAVRDVGTAAAAGVPEPWGRAVREAARAGNDRLADALDRAVATTSLEAARRPRWWSLVGALQWLLLAAAAVGMLWLLLIFVVGYLQLPDLPTPRLGDVPWPTALLLGGVIAGALLALLSRLAARLGGRRRARKATAALHAAVAEVGAELVLAPAGGERARHTDFTAHLAKARAD